MIVENETPYTAETIRLTPRAPVVSSAALGLSLILIGAAMGAGMFGGAMFLVGWKAAVFYRTLQPYIDARGTYALLWVTIAVPILAIWHTNKNPLV
jgi:hypothetical protein